jgi:periplasmic protein CpxP/Spy
MNAFKIMSLALVLLLVLNVVTLALLWRMNAAPGRPPRPSAAAEFLMRELQFQPTQREQYRQLITEHRQQMHELEAERRRLRNTLFVGLAQNDTTALAALRKLAGQTEWLTFQHFQDVRHIATPTQQTRFDQIIQGVLQKMEPPRPPDPALH